MPRYHEHSDRSAEISIDAPSSVGGCQSEPVNPSEASSHIGMPKWRRLLRAASQSLATHVAKDQNVVVQTPFDAFVFMDAQGGGSEVDIYQCLRQVFESLSDLSDLDIGTIIIGMHHFLTARDLPLSSQTWRALMVTALVVSVRIIIQEDRKRTVTEEQLFRTIKHWWPRDRAAKAVQVFTDRQAFKDGQLTPQKQAECYFALRDQGLRLNGGDLDSNASAVCSADAIGAPMRPYRSRDGSRDRFSRSVRSDESLMVSEDTVMSQSDELPHRSVTRMSL